MSEKAKGSETKLGDFYTIKQVAEITRMSESFWRQRILHKDIEYVKMGGRVNIPEKALYDFIEKGRVKPVKKDSNG